MKYNEVHWSCCHAFHVDCESGTYLIGVQHEHGTKFSVFMLHWWLLMGSIFFISGQGPERDGEWMRYEFIQVLLPSSAEIRETVPFIFFLCTHSFWSLIIFLLCSLDKSGHKSWLNTTSCYIIYLLLD